MSRAYCCAGLGSQVEGFLGLGEGCTRAPGAEKILPTSVTNADFSGCLRVTTLKDESLILVQKLHTDDVENGIGETGVNSLTLKTRGDVVLGANKYVTRGVSAMAIVI